MSNIMFFAIITTARRKLLTSFPHQICQSCCSVRGLTMLSAINIKPAKALVARDGVLLKSTETVKKL